MPDTVDNFQVSEPDAVGILAGFLLAATGRPEPVPELAAACSQVSAAAVVLREAKRLDPETLAAAVAACPFQLRLPLIGLRSEPAESSARSAWRLPDGLKSGLRTSPLSGSETNPGSLARRLAAVAWPEIGGAIEKRIRGFFGIGEETGLTVYLLGSLIWGDSPPADIDLTVIVEDRGCMIGETGGSRPGIPVAGILDKFPANWRPATETLDAAIFGFPRIRNGSYDHDLINTIAWTVSGGFCLGGEPICRALSDATLCQSVGATLGYLMKRVVLGEDGGGAKRRDLLGQQWNILGWLGRRYGCPVPGRREDPNDDIYEAVRSAGSTANRVFSAIKQACLRDLAAMVNSLRKDE